MLRVSRDMLVPKAGLEPARLAPHAPQTCVSAIPPLRLLRDVEKVQRRRSRVAWILDVPGAVRLESSLAAALPLTFLNIPPFMTLKMPFNFVLGRLLHCGVTTAYASAFSLPAASSKDILSGLRASSIRFQERAAL